ncbi:pyruvate kinase [bacterium]|nr:pyruvate kinase [bacterium]
MTAPLRTGIMCTLGPSCASQPILEAMIESGMRGVRVNFSHLTPGECERLLVPLRQAEKASGQRVRLLADLQGPRPRTATAPEGGVRLEAGRETVLCAGEAPLGAGRITLDCPELVRALVPGARVLLNDGAVELEVLEPGVEARCRIVRGGALEGRKGVNAPGLDLRLPALSAKDRADLDCLAALGFDSLALSFVRDAGSVREVRDYLAARGASLRLIAKVERAEALDNLEGILEAADGVLVARGDLGAEIGLERVPAAQKHVLRRAAALGLESITSTQMLESMCVNPVPTRAEVSDIYNAVLDGTGWLLFTGETARGRYPVEVVRVAAAVTKEAEKAYI